MVQYFGDFSEDETVYIPFNTFSSDDPSASVTITNLADGDVKVHKDGSTTEIATDGATVTIDFDSITGNHLVAIDTSVDAAYSTGSDYLVRIEGTTVDGATVNAWIGTFSIENRHSAGALRPTTAGRTLDVTSGGAAGIDWGNIENPTTAVDLSGTDIQLCDTVTTLTGHTAQTGDNYARLGTPAGASVSADIAAIEAQTDDIGGGGAGLTAIPWNSSWDAEVESEVNDALVALGLDHLVSASVTGTDVSDNSIIAKLVSKSATADWDSFVNTTDSLEAITDSGGGGPTAADIADAVWDESTSGHTSTGTFGEQVKTDIDAILTDTAEIGAAGEGLTAIPWNSSWDAEVESEVNDALVALSLDHLVSASVTGTDVTDDSIVAKLVSSSATADWDTFVNTTDSLQAITDSGGGGPTAADIADAVWDESTSGHTSAGTFGEQVKTDVDAILADTNELQTDWANGGRLDLIMDELTTNVDAVETDTQDIQSRLPAALVSGKMDSDMTAISGDTTAADNLETAMDGMVTGQAQTGTLSTTQMTTNLSESTDDHYIGRLITFVGGSLNGQQTDITDSSGTNGLLTFTALTEAPSNGQNFIIT